ncbi:MAG: alpha/beta hydrolase [Holophagaceae bacterium]|jgi:pimeloyl-ACP methyl ester carboxylesterase
MSTWILLRGLVREAGHWGGFPELLAAELPEARVIALDLPGNGSLNDHFSPVSIEAMAGHCRGELARQGVPPPYHLLAMSMGGMVAAAWAVAHPEEISASVLLNTSFGAFSPLHHRLRPGAWPYLLKVLREPSDRGREELIFDLTSNLARETHPEIVDQWTALRTSHPVRLGNTLRQLVASARFRAPQQAPVRTLLLLGAGDHLVNPQCSREIARHWGCPLAVHPWAGHDLTLDDPAWVAAEIRAWFLNS